MRSKLSRRIRVARSASGAWESPFSSSFARMNASMGVRILAACDGRTGGTAGWRIGWSDHQSGPARGGVTGSSWYGAPAAIQARMASISGVESLLLGGISPDSTFSSARLSSTFPGTNAAPDSPPLSADARRLRSNPPFFWSGLWQRTQVLERTFRTCPAKRASPVCDAACGTPCPAASAVQPSPRIARPSCHLIAGPPVEDRHRRVLNFGPIYGGGRRNAASEGRRDDSEDGLPIGLKQAELLVELGVHASGGRKAGDKPAEQQHGGAEADGMALEHEGDGREEGHALVDRGAHDELRRVHRQEPAGVARRIDLGRL